MKKIIVLSDTHCGHLLGLTPPAWHGGGTAVKEVQKNLWNWFVDNLASDYDYMIHAGDIIDGDGGKDPSFHLVTDPLVQVDMAIAALLHVNATRKIFVTGTPYHGGQNTDYERLIASAFNDDISYRRRIEIEGVRINVAHTISKTSTPVGGDIMLRKALLWDELLADDAADIILRGHVHEYRAVESEKATAITCPALKIGNADYDRYARKMSGGFYTVGFIEIDIDKGKVVRRELKKAVFKSNAREYEQI